MSAVKDLFFLLDPDADPGDKEKGDSLRQDPSSPSLVIFLLGLVLLGRKPWQVSLADVMEPTFVTKPFKSQVIL